MSDLIFSKLQDTRAVLAGFQGERSLRAVLLSPQKQRFCPFEIRMAIKSNIEFDILVDVPAVLSSSTKYDICILCCHIMGEEGILFGLRQREVAKLYSVWLWDNHHNPIINLRTSMLSDMVFPSHWHARDYLNHPSLLPGCHIPAPAKQWSPQIISVHFPNGLPLNRKNGLFGGYVRYANIAKERAAFVEHCMTRFPDHSLSLVNGSAYYQLPWTTRLNLWAEHKVQLIAPVNNDLSSRVFDSLMVGQIPLVPDTVSDLDRVVSPKLQSTLPIIRYKWCSAESAYAAWLEALARFDSDGFEGVVGRHVYARDHHSLLARIGSFAGFFRGNHSFDLAGVHGWPMWANWV